MKILLTVDPEIALPPDSYGGIERIVDMLIHQYLNKGHEVVVCAHNDSKVPCELIGWKGWRSQHKGDLLKNTKQLTTVFYKKNFDIVHSFSRLAYLVPILRSSVPKIMSYQREPTISQPRRAAKIAKKGSLVFTGCSDFIANQLAAVAEAYTIYNGAPFQRYQATERVLEDAPLVFLGRIDPIKGTHNAISVAKKANKRLIIAGSYSPFHQPYFDEKVKPYLNDQIIYKGPVNDKQKNDLLGSALAFLMPIEWDEPFGIVMAEAMACGAPVLAFNRGSVPEVVSDGLTGFISNNVEQMASDVARVHELDRLTVRRVAEERFSDETISENYLALYRKLILRKANSNY